jgi:hypothetical protein
MSTLAEMLNLVVTTLQTCPIFSNVSIMEVHPFSGQQFAFKVRAEMIAGDVVQVYLYRNGEHIDYAYQLVHDGRPVLRWDNAEHYPSLPSHPHHFHSRIGIVEPSLLNGNPEHDLPLVLGYLSDTPY